MGPTIRTPSVANLLDGERWWTGGLKPRVGTGTSGWGQEQMEPRKSDAGPFANDNYYN